MCFAPGLLKEGLSLLHWMTMISMLVICVHTAIIYPYRFKSASTKSISIPMKTFYRFISSGKHYQDSLKGLICAKNNITEVFQDGDTKIEVSLKPFFIITVTYMIFFGFILYFFMCVQKERLYFIGLIYKLLLHIIILGFIIPSEKYR